MSAGSRDIAHYKNAQLIGRGGFGSVFRATDLAHGREVAIKVLQGSMGETERRRFDRERKTMGHLGSHPNIIPVYDSGYTEAGEGYIVMELASGGSVQGMLDTQGQLSWQEAAQIMAAVANAVQMAHDNGVIHRDIKPDNILIDQFGIPKLSDFGIAAVSNNATATTSTTMTLAHAAPEVLQGQPSTEAVDIYAIGSTYYNLVTGLPPFMRAEDETVTPMLTRALTESPPDLRLFGVPDRLALVAEQSLAKTADGRQATASELSTGLSEGGSEPENIHGHAVLGPTVTAATTREPAPPDPQENATVVAPQPARVDPLPVPGYLPSEPTPSTDRAGTGTSRALWTLVAAVVIGVIGLGALILSQSNSPGPVVAANPASPTVTEAASTTTLATTSTEQEAATSAETPTTGPSTAPIVERRLSGSATASSSAQSGVDGCGGTTTYVADNVLDGQRATAWRTTGSGEGAWIEVSLSGTHQITSVGLVPGYAKLDTCDGANRFTQNRRINEVRWIIDGQSFVQRLNPDLPEMQELPLVEPVTANSVRVEILSTTAPGGRDFTAISDLEIIGG